MEKTAILAYEGCWAMSVFAATDFFRIVALLEQHLGQAPGYAVEVLSAEGAPVRTASGHVIQPDGAVAEAGTDYGLVVIPPVEGVRLHAGFVPDARLLAWLGACRQQGARVLAMTTGACFVAAGLGGPALLATHWAYARTLQQRYPARRFVARQSCLHADGVWTTGTLMPCWRCWRKTGATGFRSFAQPICWCRPPSGSIRSCRGVATTAMTRS